MHLEFHNDEGSVQADDDHIYDDELVDDASACAAFHGEDGFQGAQCFADVDTAYYHVLNCEAGDLDPVEDCSGLCAFWVVA
jgi:hypothetical protein